MDEFIQSILWMKGKAGFRAITSHSLFLRTTLWTSANLIGANHVKLLKKLPHNENNNLEHVMYIQGLLIK